MSAAIHPAAAFLAGLAKLVSGVQVEWRGCRPDPRPRIYFANHTSHLDAVVLWAALPREIRALTRPVAARDYWEKSAMRRYLATRGFHAVLVDRRVPGAEGERSQPGGPERAIEAMVEGLGDAGSLILFPEGTRGDGTELGRLRAGLYHLACRKPGIELVPAWMENLNRILPKGEVLPVPLLGRVIFGTPLTLGEGEAKQDFLDRCRSALLALHEGAK
jgi:1-acyl-sn-glycerol-3-phosphate acyltransferase